MTTSLLELLIAAKRWNEHKCENLERNNKTVKSDLNKVKNENKKLLKYREQASSRTTKTALPDNETFKDNKRDSNKNIQSDSSLRLCSSSSPPPELVCSDTSPPSTRSHARTPSAEAPPPSQISAVPGIQPITWHTCSECSIEQPNLPPEYASSESVIYYTG